MNVTVRIHVAPATMLRLEAMSDRIESLRSAIRRAAQTPIGAR